MVLNERYLVGELILGLDDNMNNRYCIHTARKRWRVKSDFESDFEFIGGSGMRYCWIGAYKFYDFKYKLADFPSKHCQAVSHSFCHITSKFHN